MPEKLQAEESQNKTHYQSSATVTSSELPRSQTPPGVFYFINLQDLGDEEKNEFKILKLHKQHKDSKMVFDVFNRHLYNRASTAKPGKRTRSKKKSQNFFVLQNLYKSGKQSDAVKSMAKLTDKSLRSSSLTPGFYNTSVLTLCKKSKSFNPILSEASSSRIFRMNSFLTNIEKLTKQKSGTKKQKKSNSISKKKSIFPNQTIMDTCNKIIDICKFDTSTGIFNLKHTGADIRFLNKSKIRKKLFSFKRSKKVKSSSPTQQRSIMAPEAFDDKEHLSTNSIFNAQTSNIRRKPICIKAESTNSSDYCELQHLSSSSDLYWTQNFTNLETSQNSFTVPAAGSSEDEMINISGEVINGKPSSNENQLCYKEDIKSSDDELITYSNHKNDKISNVNDIITRSGLLDTFQGKHLNVIVHRLPGEMLGMELQVEEHIGYIDVVSVVENGPANRASDLHGNRCPIKPLDRIAEINGVSLNVMKNEDLLSIVQELPLYVQFTLYRKNLCSPTLSIVSPYDANSTLSQTSLRNLSHETLNINIPNGYNLHTVYLSSLEAKCIMSSDFTSSEERVTGYFMIQRSTLQIADEEDHLKKGDILYNINGENLLNKNKFELCSLLSTLTGIAEICVLREIESCCYGMSSGDEIPYHNGIFAQNSIKLTMRKYENPAIKSGSEVEFLTQATSKYNADPISKSSEDVDDQQFVTHESENKMEEPMSIRENEELKLQSLHETKPVDLTTNNYSDLISCLNGQIINSLHKGNWIFLNKGHSFSSPISPGSNEANSLKNIQNSKQIVKSHLNEIQSRVSEQLVNQSKLSLLSSDNIKNESNFFLSHLFQMNTTSNEDIDIKRDFSEDSALCASARSLTSSSCHSERSIAHLNCLTCYEDDPKPFEGLFQVDDSIDCSMNQNNTENKKSEEDLNNYVNQLTSISIVSDQNGANMATEYDISMTEFDSKPSGTISLHTLSDENFIDDSAKEALMDICDLIVIEDETKAKVNNELVKSMVALVQDEANIEKELYNFLVEIINDIEIKLEVQASLERNCQDIENLESMMQTIEEMDQRSLCDENKEDKLKKEDCIEIVEKSFNEIDELVGEQCHTTLVNEHEEEISTDKKDAEVTELCHLEHIAENNSTTIITQEQLDSLANTENESERHETTETSFNIDHLDKGSISSSNSANKNDEELYSLKKLIHQELKELIKNKSNSDSDVSFDPIDCDVKSPSTMPHKKRPANCNNLLQVGPFIPRAKLKNTMQNFLQKQNPTVIYNSTVNRRNMRNVTPPPLPNANSLLQNVVHASYSNANSPTQNKCNYKSHMKSANMVFNSTTDTDLWLHVSNDKLTKCEVDAFSQRYKETTKIEEKNEMLKMVSTHVVDDFSNNLIATRAFSSTQLNKITLNNNKTEPFFDYVKSAIDKQTKQRPTNSRPSKTSQQNLSRSVSPSLTHRVNLPSEIYKHSDLKEENPDESAPDCDGLSVKEKIMIFSKKMSVPKPAVSSNIKKIYNPTICQQTKPRPLSQCIIENKVHRRSVEPNSISNVASKFNLPSSHKAGEGNKKIISKYCSVESLVKPQAHTDRSHVLSSKNLNVKPSYELPTETVDLENQLPETTEKQFQSVKDRIAYFSSKLFLEKTNKKKTEIGASDVKTKAYRVSPKTKVEGNVLQPNSSIENKQRQVTNAESNSIHYASYHNLTNFNVIYNQTSDAKYDGKRLTNLNEVNAKKFNWSNGNLSKQSQESKELKSFMNTHENKISNLIENLETKWKHQGK